MKNWRTEEELVAKIKADFKANGIKATIRRKRGGWTTSLIINITTTEKDFKPFDLYAQEYKPARRLWADGNRLISYQEWAYMEDEEKQERIRQFDMKKNYQVCREEHYQLNHYNVSWYKELTDECRNRIQKAIDICNSYNYDNSDAMTDYFDVGFYQHFELRNKGLQVA